jgi:Fe-S cluster biogenesis protein NfuA
MFIIKLKGVEGWLGSLRKRRRRKLPVSFVRRQSIRAFCFHAEKTGRNFGFVPDVCPCSSMVGNSWVMSKETLKKGEKKMKEEIEKALQNIRPALQADGGDVELVDVTDGVVKVRLKGACGGCPMSQMTLTRGVEATIKRFVPEVIRVEAV